MTRGSIRKHERDTGIRYEVVVDLGIDPVTGKRRQRTKSFPTKKEAKAALTSWLSEIDKGTAVDRSKETVAEMMRYWFDTYARPNVRPKTLQIYEETITRHLIPGLGSIQVQKLSPADVQAFYARKQAEGTGAWALLGCHQRLSQALTQAMRLGLIQRNVCDLVTPPRLRHWEMTTWDAAQARRFLSVARQSSYGPIWIVALTTGMRRGELLGLRWKDADIEGGVLHVRQSIGLLHGQITISQPKSDTSRRAVPVEPQVIAALREHRAKQNERRLALGAVWEDHDLIFAAANGKPVNPDNLRRDYDHLVALAGVPRIRIHDVRHTHVTLGFAAGANIKAMSRRIGHAQTSLTMDIYAHVLPEQHREVSTKIGAVLFGEHADDHSEVV